MVATLGVLGCYKTAVSTEGRHEARGRQDQIPMSSAPCRRGKKGKMKPDGHQAAPLCSHSQTNTCLANISLVLGKPSRMVGVGGSPAGHQGTREGRVSGDGTRAAHRCPFQSHHRERQ